MKALFLSQRQSLAPGGGGQQHCSREYHETLTAAGFDLVDVTYDVDRFWAVRLRRKFRPEPYANLIPADFFRKLAGIAAADKPAFVFCNLHDFVPAAARIRSLVPVGTRLALLSHGLASVDELHAARIARSSAASAHVRAISDAWLGARLRVESEGLPKFDHVFCLAPFEVEICRWLGAQSASWLPRVMETGKSLPWNPSGNRIGCIGTFDHPPNLEGLDAFCASLAARGPGKLRVRLVTRSDSFASDLASRYAFVDALGPLDVPGAAEAEASTWSAFVHPVFCYAMGCSTKVATGLSWNLPVLTTEAGLRGYTWNAGNLAPADSADALASRALDMLEPGRAAALRQEVIKAVRSSPSRRDVAEQIRRDLGLARLETNADTAVS